MTQLFSSIIIFNPDAILYLITRVAIVLGCVGVAAAIVHKFQDYL